MTGKSNGHHFHPFITCLSTYIQRTCRSFIHHSIHLITISEPSSISKDILLLLYITLFFFHLITYGQLFYLKRNLPKPHLLFFSIDMRNEHTKTLLLKYRQIPRFSYPEKSPCQILSLVLFEATCCQISRE